MRRIVVCAALGIAVTGCGEQDPPRAGGTCATDTDCSVGQVCARTLECIAPADVRAVRVTWTIAGSAANATSCMKNPDLVVKLEDSTAGTFDDDTWGYLPVACAAGVFPIDKLPTRYTSAVLGIDADTGADSDFDDPADAQTSPIDATGTATFDLPAP